MSTLNDIFKKLEDKTELSSHQVELGIADDMAKLSSEAEAQLSKLKADDVNLRNIDKAIQDAKNLGKTEMAKAVKNIDSALATMKKITVALDKADKSAKDLGLDPKTIPAFSPLSKAFDILEVYTEDKEFNQFKNL